MFVEFQALPFRYQQMAMAPLCSQFSSAHHTTLFWLDGQGILRGAVMKQNLGPCKVLLGYTISEITYAAQHAYGGGVCMPLERAEQYFKEKYPESILTAMDFKAVDF
jgi:hypothetical protein